MQNIRFDFGWGMLAFQQGLADALIAEAGRADSPLANQVIVNRLSALQGQTGQILALLQQAPAKATPTPAAPPAPPVPLLPPSAAPSYHSCFISYSSRDQIFAGRLYDDLVRAGVSCWYAPEDLAIGAKVRQAIDGAIDTADKLLLILSANSIASAWVEAEAEAAFDKEVGDKLRMFPIRLDDMVMQTDTAWAAHIRRTRYIGDFQQWQDAVAYERSLRRLLRDLTRTDAPASNSQRS